MSFLDVTRLTTSVLTYKEGQVNLQTISHIESLPKQPPSWSLVQDNQFIPQIKNYSYLSFRSVLDGIGDDGAQCSIASLRFLAAFQQKTVAGAQGQRGDLRQALGATLEDNQQHTYFMQYVDIIFASQKRRK